MSRDRSTHYGPFTHLRCETLKTHLNLGTLGQESKIERKAERKREREERGREREASVMHVLSDTRALTFIFHAKNIALAKHVQ